MCVYLLNAPREFSVKFTAGDRPADTKDDTPNPLESLSASGSTLEEFAVYYLNLVKSQTDEFIKSSTSTCNTPRKLTNIADNGALPGTMTSNVTQQAINEKKMLGDCGVNGVECSNVENDDNDNGVDGGSSAVNKRQISRELFVVDKQNNSNSVGGYGNVLARNKGSNFNSSTFGSSNSNYYETTTTTTFAENESPNAMSRKSYIAGGDLEIEGGGVVVGGGKLDFVIGMNKTSTSTPMQSSSFSKVNRSIDDPTLTSTPNSFRNNTNNSFSLDHSGIVKGNSIKRNQLNDSNNKSNSMSRRNTTSSPMCLGDFMNASGNSGKGSRKKLVQQSTPIENGSVFSSNDFPSLSGSVSQKRVTPISVPATSVTATAQPIEVRPKKRVVPITISRRTSGSGTGNTVGGNVINSSFVSSSFQQENNLLNVMSFETDPRSDVMSERRMLRDCRDAITKDFTREQEPARHLHAFIKETLPSSAGDVKAPGTPRKLSIFKYHEEKVVEKEMLLRMAMVYSFLMDMNLIPNILTELSYLINLLNTDHDPYEQVAPQNPPHSTDKSSMLLKNLTNCIYFTTHTLIAQRNVLALLDVTTIRVLIDNERIQQFPELYEHLKLVQQRKVQLEDVALTLAHKNQLNGSISGGNVFFQQETDNRDNFPSDREFGAFKKQRDMFYSILRAWEFKHLDPTWEFQTDLGIKVRQLLMVLEHPINMAHLAKLFVAQLIISCNFDNSANELEMVLPGIDLSKLSKLRQRLVAPSTFSTQYLFPGSQAFFRDFIQCCDYHLMFIEQLKIGLISELLQMNDSSYEILSIVNDGVTNSNTIVSTTNPDDDKEQNVQDYIVRAETLTTMRVLAKFVGFVVSRPFVYDGYRNVLVDQKQSKIRNLLHPDFDVKSVLVKAIDNRKLLVTLPWLVQYLSMLDFITIRLDYYRETFQMMYTLYMQLNDIESHQKYCVMPTSKFIIRTCLGWLFEHPNVPEEYYNYQSSKRDLSGVDLVMKKSKRKPIVPGSDILPLNPLLESILDAACPFLADFRVSVMPSKFTKTVSRTGRYRHITTKYSDTSKIQNKSKVQDNHQKLVEAFLQSQSLSVKKTVDFVIERVTSAVVKDFQVKHLLGIRKQAKLEVDQLKRTDLETLTKSMFAIYNKSLEQLQIKWNEEFGVNTRKRVQESFDALLPFETLDAVKKTLIELTVEKTHEKVNEWRVTNISTLALFSKDIQGDAAKVLKNNQQLNNNRSTQSMVLDLNTSTVPSNYFFEFQKLLHFANLYPGHLKPGDLMKFLEVSKEIINKQVFPLNSYRTIAFYLLQLLHSIVANRPDLLTKDMLDKFIDLWHHEKLKMFTSDEVETPKMTASNFIFSSVISARFILTMNRKPRASFELFSNVLIELVKNNFLNLENINEQSVRLYKNEWDKETLDNIAFMIERVSNSMPTIKSDLDHTESKLFLDLVADLARDMEDF